MNVVPNGAYCLINDVHISQMPQAIMELSKIIKDFDAIIEIGFYRGGLTQFFAEESNDKCQVIAFDISDNERLQQNFKFNKKINFIVDDCFSLASTNLIKNIINDHNKVLVFCDGGNKAKEFSLFSSLLKSNDHIMTHDFSETNFYPPGINWPHDRPECRLDDIIESIRLNNLVGFNYENFKLCVIGSFIKK